MNNAKLAVKKSHLQGHRVQVKPGHIGATCAKGVHSRCFALCCACKCHSVGQK